MAIRRRSQFRNRLNKLQGLPIDEKMMLLRMGEIIDRGINQRTPTNPDPNRGHLRAEIPMPVGLNVEVSTRGAVLSWNKIDSNNLLNYRIRITPIGGEGEELIVTSYTNQFLFKGRAGRYRFTVQSNSRDGKASDWAPTVEFQISDTPMILEGNKLDVEELGSQLFETVLTPLNYTVFAFASVVLNTLADPNDNPSVVLELRHGATYASSVFIQEFSLYPESEDLCNFDATVGITRPSGAPSRTGNFETTQSVMFTPYQILEATGIADLNTTFWITVTSHSDDVVGMSCAIWVASEGLSEENAAEFPTHKKAISLPFRVSALDKCPGFWEFGFSEDTDMNNTWTYAAWMKPSSLSSTFTIMRYAEVTGGALKTFSSRKAILISYDTTPRLNVQIFNETGTSSGIWRKNGQSNVWPLGLDNWHFLVATGNGNLAGSKVRVYINGQELSPDSDTTGSVSIPSFSSFSTPRMINICGRPSTGLFTEFTAGIMGGGGEIFSGRLHSAGLWNVTLTTEAIAELYNNGNGFQKDWRFSSGAYGSIQDLIHYWKFGSNENIFIGPANSDWLISRPIASSPPFLGGGEPYQLEVDFNILNDVAYDIGQAGEPGNHRPYNFSNSISIDGDSALEIGSGEISTGGSPFFLNTSFAFQYPNAAPYPPISSNRNPNALDVVNDYPGI